LLIPLHREGQHKARAFAFALGLPLDNASVLRRAVLDAAVASDDVERAATTASAKSSSRVSRWKPRPARLCATAAA
jgi:hypothetical protein